MTRELRPSKTPFIIPYFIDQTYILVLVLSIKYRYLYLKFTSKDEKHKTVSNDLGTYTLFRAIL